MIVISLLALSPVIGNNEHRFTCRYYTLGLIGFVTIIYLTYMTLEIMNMLVRFSVSDVQPFVFMIALDDLTNMNMQLIIYQVVCLMR